MEGLIFGILRYLKKTQFYAPAQSLSFGKTLYLLDDVPSFEDTFRRIILLLFQIGKKRDGKWENKSAYRWLYVYQRNLEQFQVSSRSNYWCFVTVLTIALLQTKMENICCSFPAFFEI